MAENLLERLADWLRLPELRDVDPESPEILGIQRRILARRRFLQAVFGHFYSTCLGLEKEMLEGDGLRVELGSGTGYVREIDPGIITSDVRRGEGIDRYLDATCLELEDASVSMLLAINVFHHIPDPMAFFSEACRVLVPGGGIIIVEPWHGPVGSLLYSRLFRTEKFDKSLGWIQPDAQQMSGANQALSYIIFHRDRERFLDGWPDLRILHEDVFDNYISYMLSGGVNFRQLVPSWSYRAVRMLEWLLRPLRRLAGLHHVIVIRRE